MNLECKNAQVNLYWDGDKTMDLVICNQRGDILLVQTQNDGSVTTNIHKENKWEYDDAKEI